MRTLLKTGTVLVSLFAGITAVMAEPVQLTVDDNFGTDEFWTTQGE